jgi:hypothetical protein
LRSVLLVFMDNVTAEYSFLRGFFSVEASTPQTISIPETPLFSPTVLSPTGQPELESLGTRSRSGSIATLPSTLPDSAKEEHAKIDALWKQVFDPVMTYVQVFRHTSLRLSGIHSFHFTDFHTFRARTTASGHITSYHDTSHGEHRDGSRESRLSSSRNICFWPEVTAVADIPEAHERKYRGSEKTCRGLKWRVFQSSRGD